MLTGPADGGSERGEKRRGAEGQRRRAGGFEGQPSVQNVEYRTGNVESRSSERCELGSREVLRMSPETTDWEEERRDADA